MAGESFMSCETFSSSVMRAKQVVDALLHGCRRVLIGRYVPAGAAGQPYGRHDQGGGGQMFNGTMHVEAGFRNVNFLCQQAM